MTMSRASPCPSSDGSPSRQITVVDVYDLASGIGQDFEKLIDQFGSECVRDLMPKVISSLETLEALAGRNERENEEIASLTSKVEHLEAEKQERLDKRHKFETELEHIEENYRREIKELWEMVNKLQADNKKLHAAISHHEPQSPTMGVSEEEVGLLRTLRGTVEGQRTELKAVQAEAEQRDRELDALHAQTDKLLRTNKELARKIKAVQNQGRSLVEEKAELISQLQRSEANLYALEHKLGETEKAKKDLEQTKAQAGVAIEAKKGEGVTLEDVRTMLKARMALLALHSPGSEAEMGENTPRFTLSELREVLQEKNSLKARVMELEEELGSLRPPPTPSPAPSTIGEDEFVVYGPLPREPEEKLYPWKYQRRESGVRKFFNSLWAGTSSNSASPRKVPHSSGAPGPRINLLAPSS